MEMSGDEILCLFACCYLVIFGWGPWCSWVLNNNDFGRHLAVRAAAIVVPVLAFAGLFAVLRTAAAHDVRDSGLYTFFYLIMGAAWLRVVVVGLGNCMGLVLRDDWIERGNPAAAICGAGLLFGGMAAFAGGNIGDGPGWWVVIFSAALSTGAMFLGLVFLNLAADVIERITVGRDVSLAVRTGAYLLMAGVIAGRAVAGDWVSAGATVSDFAAAAWPLLAITATLCCVEFVFRRSRLSLGASGLFAAVELGCAAYFLVWAGAW